MQLSDHLEQSGESIPSFAARIGVSPQAVHRYLHDQRRPKWPILEKIKTATNGQVTPNDFLG